MKFYDVTFFADDNTRAEARDDGNISWPITLTINSGKHFTSTPAVRIYLTHLGLHHLIQTLNDSYNKLLAGAKDGI